MTGDYTSQHTDLRLPSSGSRKPDWRSRAAPTPRELTAALARLKQRCPEGLPAEIEALLENREIAFVRCGHGPPLARGASPAGAEGRRPFPRCPRLPSDRAAGALKLPPEPRGFMGSRLLLRAANQSARPGASRGC